MVDASPRIGYGCIHHLSSTMVSVHNAYFAPTRAVGTGSQGRITRMLVTRPRVEPDPSSHRCCRDSMRYSAIGRVEFQLSVQFTIWFGMTVHMSKTNFKTGVPCMDQPTGMIRPREARNACTPVQVRLCRTCPRILRTLYHHTPPVVSPH